MNKISINIIKGLKKIYTSILPTALMGGRNWKMFSNKEYSNQVIYNMLMEESPCMIGRIGSTEMLCIINYLGIKEKKGIEAYVKGKSFPSWWEPSTLSQMQNWSGFFPSTPDNAIKFSEMMLEDMKSLDLLGSWLNQEVYVNDYLKQAKQVVLEDLEPFFSNNPWTKALEGKKVLVIHPFKEAIELQYEKRNKLFENNLLPDFELKTVKAVQSLGGDNAEYNSWFEALEGMKSQIESIDFDIAIIGCGAYGFPLAAHIKRMGKKAVHLGGVTQLLFGIKGGRWEQHIVWPYMNLFNEHWIRPGDKLKPKNADQVEGACYW